MSETDAEHPAAAGPEGHGQHGGEGAHEPHAGGDSGHHGGHAEHGEHGDHHAHHAAMIADFRRRFWASLILTVPILALSPLIQSALGLRELLAFPGDGYVLFVLSAVVFVYGGKPFLVGLKDELARREPGMMTLIGLAIGVAFLYSSAVVFGLAGKVFFWELATLIDVMLLGHWIEMRSVMGASGALQSLVQLMPHTAYRLTDSGETEEVSVT
ncbi:MAG TPA: heavy metal translocating P-type ATPase, partial [Gammaproteobacteria bacterium]|nr:heavy metal translocating P-type ATPase [Gammaproteobacteria bacterium]